MAKKAIVKSAAKKIASKGGAAATAGKRPRGRPRLDGLTPGSPEALAADAAKKKNKSSSKGRSPGRPRKDGLTPGSPEAIAADASKPKRPRGRPRKDGLIPGSPEAIAADAAKGIVRPDQAKVRGDRRKKQNKQNVRRKSDKRMVSFDGDTPNHLVIAIVEGAAVDHRFKAKVDAESCISKLLNSGIQPNKIAYYAKQNFDYTVRVSL